MRLSSRRACCPFALGSSQACHCELAKGAVLHPPLGVYTQVMPRGSQSVQFHRSLSKNSCEAGTAGTSLMSDAQSRVYLCTTGGVLQVVHAAQCSSRMPQPLLLHLLMQNDHCKPIGSSAQVGSCLRRGLPGRVCRLLGAGDHHAPVCEVHRLTVKVSRQAGLLLAVLHSQPGRWPVLCTAAQPAPLTMLPYMQEVLLHCCTASHLAPQPASSHITAAHHVLIGDARLVLDGLEVVALAAGVDLLRGVAAGGG